MNQIGKLKWLLHLLLQFYSTYDHDMLVINEEECFCLKIKGEIHLLYECMLEVIMSMFRAETEGWLHYI